MTKTLIKDVVDRHLPAVARAYRRLRDERTFAGLKEVHTSMGLTLTIEPGVAKAILGSNEMSTLQTLLATQDVFVDVGANLGVYSCIAASENKYVIAIEPHPLNLQILYRNFRRNGLDRNFEVHAAALGDRKRIGGLFGGQQGGSLIAGWGGIQSNYETTVFVNTLDHLLAERFLDQRLLIKVDVEGNEHAVLLGASKTLSRDPAPIWTVEIGLTENFAGATNPKFYEIFEIFWSYGYRASPLSRPGQIVAREDLTRWMRDCKTDHGDINYQFVKNVIGE